MFVIVQCLSNFEDSDPKFGDKTIDLLIGETLKHAGVAITITSLTDLVVFAVGAITVIFEMFLILFSKINILGPDIYYFIDGRSLSIHNQRFNI